MQIRKLSASAVAVFLVCAVTVYSGANLLLYLRAAERAADALTDSAVSGTWKSFVANWKDATGVADPVRSLSLTGVRIETPDDKAAIERAISEIVENSPTSDTVWQDLAEIRFARGSPIDQVLAAFHMSVITGSHEGLSMIQRAKFWLEHWTELPASDRRIVARDVLATIGPRYTPETTYREIIARKPAAERHEVRSAFLASGLATPARMRALGE